MLAKCTLEPINNPVITEPDFIPSGICPQNTLSLPASCNKNNLIHILVIYSRPKFHIAFRINILNEIGNIRLVEQRKN